MAKKRASRPARAVKKARASVTNMEKGDVSLPSPKMDKKKWLYIGAAVVILLLAALYLSGRFA